VLRAQAQDVDQLSSIVRGEASRALRSLSSFQLSADWVPAVTSAHVCAVRVVDAAVPIDRVCVVESWSLDSSFSMELTVAPAPTSFDAGVGLAPSVRAGAREAVDTFPAVVRSVSPLQVRLLGDGLDVGVPLLDSGLTLSVDDVVSVGRVGSSWYVVSELSVSS
jgi:hypothetical protein